METSVTWPLIATIFCIVKYTFEIDFSFWFPQHLTSSMKKPVMEFCNVLARSKDVLNPWIDIRELQCQIVHVAIRHHVFDWPLQVLLSWFWRSMFKKIAGIRRAEMEDIKEM